MCNETYFITKLDGSLHQRVWQGLEAGSNTISLSPDGHLIAYSTFFGGDPISRPKNKCYLANVDGSETTEIGSMDCHFLGADRKAAWSPDGNYLIYRESVQQDQIKLYSVDDHQIVNLPAADLPYCADAVWFSDNNRVILYHCYQAVNKEKVEYPALLFDVQKNTIVQISGSASCAVVPSPDEQQLWIYNCSDPKVASNLYSMLSLQTQFSQTIFPGLKIIDDLNGAYISSVQPSRWIKNAFTLTPPATPQAQAVVQPTEIVRPAEVIEQTISGVKVEPAFDYAKQEWVWILNGKIERIFDNDSRRIMAYSESPGALIISETDLDNGLYVDNKAITEDAANKTIKEYCELLGIDPDTVKGFKFVMTFGKYFNPAGMTEGREYFQDYEPDSYFVRPKIDNEGYLEFKWYKLEFWTLVTSRKVVTERRFPNPDGQLGTTGILMMLTYGILPRGTELEFIAHPNDDPYHNYVVTAYDTLGQYFAPRTARIK